MSKVPLAMLIGVLCMVVLVPSSSSAAPAGKPSLLMVVQAAPVTAPSGSDNQQQQSSQKKCMPAGKTPKEILTAAKSTLEKSRKQLEKLYVLLEEARQEKDIVKTNQLNEKILSAKALLKVAEKSLVNIEAALSKNDIDLSMYEMEKICILDSKMDLVMVESAGIAGQSGFAKTGGEVNVEVEEPKGGSKSDLSNQPLDQTVPASPLDLPDRPFRASPYQ